MAVAFRPHGGCRAASGVRKRALPVQLHRGCQTRLSLGHILGGSGGCTLAAWRMTQAASVVKNLALPQRQLLFCVIVDFRSHVPWENLLCESGFANVTPGLITGVAVRWQQQGTAHFRRTAGTRYTTVAAALMLASWQLRAESFLRKLPYGSGSGRCSFAAVTQKALDASPH